MTIRRKITLAILFAIFLTGYIFFVYNKIYFTQGSASQSRTISIENGNNALVVGEKLSDAGVIKGKYYFLFYLWKIGKVHSIIAGVYEFPKGMQIPEAAKIVTGGEVVPMRVKVTFPEGWTIDQISDRLTSNNLPGEKFKEIAAKPSVQLLASYAFLRDLPQNASLEGYLFPDTYYFSKEATADEIIKKMLDNFSVRYSTVIKPELDNQKKTLFEIITMASIVEGEVKNDSDRKIVAGLFWNRLDSGMPLQSDATLEYVLGSNKFQHSIAETKIDSPYNTYQVKGLPPGPVSNPGISSILATLDPLPTDYVYFLSDPKTGKTVFAKTFEEHVANKDKYGL